MAYYFAEGSKFYFSSTFAAAKTITVMSNANPALATSVSHGYSDNDEILLISGWEDATDSIYRIDQQSVDTFDVDGLNTTDTDWFPSGSGTGSAYKISSWVEIPQVLNVQPQGGDPRMTNIEPIAKRNSIAVPTGFNAASIQLTMGHDPANASYLLMVNISRTLAPVAFKMTISGGAVAYGYGYLGVSEVPQLAKNQPNTVQASISVLGRFISY